MALEDVVVGLVRASPLYVMVTILVLRARRLASQGRPVPTWRLALFVAGIAVAIVADLPPIGTESEQRLSIHMIQHLLIGDLAALLIAVSMTGPLLRPMLTVPGLRRLRWLVHPLVAVPLWVVVYYGWHIPALYQAAVGSDVVHAGQHATMFAAGLGLWIGLLGPLPKPAWFGNAAGLIYIVAIKLAGGAIANAFIWSNTPFYPTYAEIARSRGFDAVADQSIAGAIWMLEASVVTMGVLGWIFMRWMSQSEAAQDLVDHALRLGVDLDPDRARRAVAAGASDRLRDRVERQAAEARSQATASTEAAHEVGDGAPRQRRSSEPSWRAAPEAE